MPAKKKARKPNGASHPHSKPKVKPSAKRKTRKPNVAPHPYKPKVKLYVILKYPGPGIRCTSLIHRRPRTKKLKPSQKDIIVQPLGGKTPLECFFSQYTYYKCQPLNPPVVEFNRLCDASGWERDDPERKAAREAFQYAMKMEFNDLYGSDEKDINNWRKLCHVLRIDPAPDTLSKCRSVSCRSSEPPCWRPLCELVFLYTGSPQEAC